ncbi:site-specific DNA-methyltransferase [Desulfovibrio desulfuricans]|uniref:site-specific DNA-methyltransferase n=1 Tax=Desulfovibrio desulfuricans TaxID=876 RepID=UPI0017827F99|nr:site-specific DNA-methyltransferase [Desulfovibrio desulfuricans]MBD8896196.1 site-specific DNA-methyltransferase [Desulfovibrio desulfuricans]
MNKLKLHTPNLTQGNIARIRELFPNCVTEAKGEDGKVKLAVDFDLLRQELSESIVEGPQERYQLNWPGKREALLTANAPIAKTLRPCREESVDFDTTKNLFIEGDNLDALKLLQETYLGKVKMIYIDPPYNTGKDFIYEDDFAENADDFLKRSNQKDEEGNRLVANTEANGRFHSDWLSMMYPRLKLARNLLRDDGVIFISIDNCEAANLRKLCDEIFGAETFVAEFVWKRRVASAMSDNNVSADQDYVICYNKGNIQSFRGSYKDFKKYSNPDNDPRGPWIADNLTVGMNASMRPNQAYDLRDPATGIIYPFNPNRVWAFIPESMEKMIADGRIIFPNNPQKRPMQKRFKNELKSTCNPFSTLMIDRVGLNTEATRTIQDLMGGNIFDYSKPTSLLTTLTQQVTDDKDLILDFFAGSSVTAHAVMQLNAEDGGNRQFIMVQLPEPCAENSEAFKSGYKTIADIGKERIRRAGAKIKAELAQQGTVQGSLLAPDAQRTTPLDIGFRVLKVDSSNMADVYYTPDTLSQSMLDMMTDNIKLGRTPEDLLFQVLLDWGVDLTLPIRKETIMGKTVFFVDENALLACFDTGLTEELVKELTRSAPLRVVFRDTGFASDAVKINATQIFRQLSPGTEVKAI